MSYANSQTNVVFQSRSGFSPCLDDVSASIRRVLSRFQSRSGFSPCLDKTTSWPSGGSRIVSIPFRVFSLPRPSPPQQRPSRLEVSIPFRVFSLPRLYERTVVLDDQRVSIPFRVFSLPRRTRDLLDFGSAPRFNPVPGFLPASTWNREHDVRMTDQFQSRSGFSPCLDFRGRPTGTRRGRVSIPFRVFSLPRQGVNIRL